MRASAPPGVAPEPLGNSGRIIWGVFVSGRVCVFFSRDGVVIQGVVAQPRRLVFRFGIGRVRVVDPGVSAVRVAEAVS